GATRAGRRCSPASWILWCRSTSSPGTWCAAAAPIARATRSARTSTSRLLAPASLTFQTDRMKRFIITGAPGAGKTAIIRQLELESFSVVEEAATDVIAAAQAQGTPEPWKHPSFIDLIVNLQRDRRIRASCQPDDVQFHDRSAVCTAALAVYLAYP